MKVEHRSRRTRKSRQRLRGVGRTLTTAVVVLVAAAITAALSVLAFAHTRTVSSPCEPGEQLVAFVGDSYTSGAGTDSGETSRYPALVGASLGVPVQVRGFNGSGYVARGPKPYDTTFPEAARQVDPEARLVVVFGSRNDAASDDVDITSRQIRTKVAETVAEIRQRAPRAQIVLIGPPWINNKPPARIEQARDAVRAAADDAGVPFVDPLEAGWFAEEDEIEDGKSRLIADDHIHPNDEGHRYLAQKIGAVVRPYLACTAASSSSSEES